jgi:hypothetical protein
MQPVDPDRRHHHRGGDAEAEVDQAGREGALVLMRQRPDGREDREAEEQQRERVQVAEGEASVGSERDGQAGRLARTW